MVRWLGTKKIKNKNRRKKELERGYEKYVKKLKKKKLQWQKYEN